MNTLGVDCGLTTGWSVRFDGGSHASGVWKLRGNSLDGAGMVLLNLRSLLFAVFEKVPVAKVTVEKPAGLMRNGSATFWANALVGTVLAVCEERKIPCETVNPSQVKRFACGEQGGNAKKEKVVEAAKLRWPDYEFATPDECDARFLAEIGFHGAPAMTPKKPRKKKPVTS